MNKQQRDYEKSKTGKAARRNEDGGAGEILLKGRGLMDSEGTEADSLYKIEDEALFDMACKNFDALPGIPELNEEYARAGEALRAAEEALVEYALSIAPQATARTLRESVKNNYTIRQKIITLTMKLDTTTVKNKIKNKAVPSAGRGEREKNMLGYNFVKSNIGHDGIGYMCFDLEPEKA